MASGQPAGQQTTTGNEDYLDKALDKGESFLGKKSGHNIDSTKMRSTNEKITDKLRNAFEKATGKTVPEKYSN